MAKKRKPTKYKPNIEKQSLWKRAIARVQKGWKSVFYILGVLAALSGALSFLPKISVTSSGPLDSLNPFSAPFIISNDGILPIYSVNIHIYPRNVRDASGAEVILKQGIKSSNPPIPIMAPGEKVTLGLPFPFIFQAPLISADIEYVVIYRPDWIFWHQCKQFRFGLTKNSSGSYIWLPRGMSEP